MYIGVDIGGTNIAAGLVNEDGEILHKGEIPTGVGRPFEEIMKDLSLLINNIINESGHRMEDIKSIGTGSPGLPDKDKGTIVFANNLDWYDVPIRGELEKYFDLPIYIENDGNTAGLAEAVAGACKGASNSITLTLGTGIGGGVVIDGKPYSGTHSVGGELGHMILHVDGIMCTCGNRGCWERYASATALIREGREGAEKNRDSLIFRSVDGNLDEITGKTVIDAAKVGDKLALEIYDRYIYYLAMGIITLINSFDPGIIAIGGGVARAGNFLMDSLKKKVEEHLFYKDAPYSELVMAVLGNDAGIIGAAMLGKL